MYFSRQTFYEPDTCVSLAVGIIDGLVAHLSVKLFISIGRSSNPCGARNKGVGECVGEASSMSAKNTSLWSLSGEAVTPLSRMTGSPELAAGDLVRTARGSEDGDSNLEKDNEAFGEGRAGEIGEFACIVFDMQVAAWKR